MRAFRLLVRGENFLVRLGADQPRSLCFYVPIFVVAPDQDAAVKRAQEQLRERLVEKRVGFSSESQTTFESIEEIALAEVPNVAPGFSWFKGSGNSS